jgi:dihydroorotase
MGADANLAGSITTHHLMINRNAILAGGIKPHYYCLPVAKRESHRLALRKAATSGDRRFFLGTDSAPHSDDRKECACCAAGCFTATNTMPILAEVFQRAGALERLEGFVAHHGADWYGLARNTGTMTLERQESPVVFPARIDTGVRAGDTISPWYDPMIAKVITHGPTRAIALARLRSALAETQVRLRGSGAWQPPRRR